MHVLTCNQHNCAGHRPSLMLHGPVKIREETSLLRYSGKNALLSAPLTEQGCKSPILWHVPLRPVESVLLPMVIASLVLLMTAAFVLIP